MSTIRADELVEDGARRVRRAALRAKLFCTPDAEPLDHAAAAGAVPEDPHLLFVCLGNVCRSPFAARFAEREADRRGASATAESAGFIRESGRPTPAVGVSVAAEYGVDLTKHRSSVLEEAALNRADVVFVMDLENYQRLRHSHPDVDAFFLRPLATRRPHAFEVADPHRDGRAAFERAYGDIAGAIRALFDDAVEGA